MRIEKLLKEGKAAIDAMIIIGVFILCFFPLWIINFYRTFEVTACGGYPYCSLSLRFYNGLESRSLLHTKEGL